MFGRRGVPGAGDLESGAAKPSPQPKPTAAEPPPEQPKKAAKAAPEPKKAAAKKTEAPKPDPAPVAGGAAPGGGGATVQRSENYYDVKSTIFAALLDTIDLSQLAKLETESAREEIRDIVNDIIGLKNIVMSISEQEDLLEDICNDVLGLGPLEPLLARDDIADIMVNGANKTYIEVSGKMQDTTIRFPRQCPADEHLSAHRQPGRPAR